MMIWKHYDLQPEDFEPEDHDMVTEEAIRKYVRKTVDIPAGQDIEMLNNDWWTEGQRGEFYLDGWIEIIVKQEGDEI